MSYIINNSRGQVVAVVADGTVNTTSTDLALIGQSVTNYGAYQNENYVYLLENFANTSAPLIPVLGQLWYNSSTDIISSYSSANTWISLASRSYVDSTVAAAKISPVFTGTPTAPTATIGTSNTQIATTAFVQNAFIDFSGHATLTGNSTAETASFGANTTQIATTAFVQSAINGGGTGNTTITGNLSVSGRITSLSQTVTGNISGGNLITAGLVTATGSIIGGSLVSAGLVTATGNITGGNLITAGLVTATGNITGGNLSTGIISATGNITGGNLSTGIVTADTVYATNFISSGTPTSAFRLPNLTQTQINELSAQNGDMVYNTTEDLPQVFQNSSWKNFTISYYS